MNDNNNLPTGSADFHGDLHRADTSTPDAARDWGMGATVSHYGELDRENAGAQINKN